MAMATVWGIITHRDEDTREDTAWGILYEDGSVKWYDSLEEAEYYYPSEDSSTNTESN